MNDKLAVLILAAIVGILIAYLAPFAMRADCISDGMRSGYATESIKELCK